MKKAFLSRQHWAVWAIAAFSVLLLCSCIGPLAEDRLDQVVPSAGFEFVKVGDWASVTVAPTEIRTIVKVAVIPAHAVVPTGEVLLFSAVGYDQTGREIGDVRFVWSMASSSAGSISPNGVFRAGPSTGTFSDAVSVVAIQETREYVNEVNQTATVSVARSISAHDIDRLMVFPDKIRVEREKKIRLSALTLDRDNVVILDVPMVWTMEVPVLGSIDDRGLFTASSQEGFSEHAIRVVAEDDFGNVFSAFVSVEVTSGPQMPSLTSVTIMPQAVALQPGDRFRFSSISLDQQGTRLVNVQTEWSLAAPNVGQLDDIGQLLVDGPTGTYPGAIKVVVTSRGQNDSITLTAGATVTILNPPESIGDVTGELTHLAIYPREVTLSPGKSTRFSLVGLDTNGMLVRGLETQWSIDDRIGEVTNRGRFTAGDNPGIYRDAVRATVWHETKEGRVSSDAAATVVIVGRLTRVIVTPKYITVDPGTKIQYTAAAYDSNGVRITDVAFNWSVDDAQVGTIDGHGLFTASRTLGDYSRAVRVEAVQTQRSG